jgi:hypothetical protein
VSSTQAIRAKEIAPPIGMRRILDKYFYFFMSLLIAGIVVYGFSRTIGQRLFHPQVKPPTLLWFHGSVFFGWVGLFILQSLLVRTRNTQVHKRLGWYFAGFGAIIPILGVTITRVMARFQVTTLHENPLERFPFMAIPLQDMVAFTGAFGLAVLWRKRPEYHRRLMLIAACALTAAAWGRLPTFINVPYISFYSGVDALILLGVLRDLFVIRRVHAVYLCFLPPLLLIQLGAVFIASHNPAWWTGFSHFFTGI